MSGGCVARLKGGKGWGAATVAVGPAEAGGEGTWERRATETGLPMYEGAAGERRSGGACLAAVGTAMVVAAAGWEEKPAAAAGGEERLAVGEAKADMASR